MSEKLINDNNENEYVATPNNKISIKSSLKTSNNDSNLSIIDIN